MKGHMLNLISEARHAFSTLTSAADKLAMRRIESIGRTSGMVGETLDFERIGLAKRGGMAALDKLEHILNAEELK